MNKTRERILKLSKLIKEQFPNLTVMQVIELVDKIMDVVEETDATETK